MSLLESLPDELLHNIFTRLSYTEQSKIARASWRCYHLITPILYRYVELVDRHNPYYNDDHDDIPMIRILLVLAENPYLASKVQELTHKCRLPQPDVLTELPALSLLDSTLSCDTRTLRLLRLAIQKLVNVHTLRIIFGHRTVVAGLLHGFFDKRRNSNQCVTRLWLEGCSLEGILWPGSVIDLLGGLKSVRFRRLRARSENADDDHAPTSSRTRRGLSWGQRLYPYVHIYPLSPAMEISRYEDYMSDGIEGPVSQARAWNDAIYRCLPDVERFLETAREKEHDEGNIISSPQHQPCLDDEKPAWSMSQLVTCSSSTLVSLNIDWVFNGCLLVRNDWIALTTFPMLRALQVRNAVVTSTRLKLSCMTSLLEGQWLDFLERHPQLQCLAWPLECFYSDSQFLSHLPSRAENVVVNLGRTLKELRIDADLLFQSEPTTDSSDPNAIWHSSSGPGGPQARLRRRFFIHYIAPHFSTLEVLKLEGGIPFDERNEIVRAVSFSPLRKLVVIGVAFPPGNTWQQLRTDERQAFSNGEVDMQDGTRTHRPEDVPSASTRPEEWSALQTDALSSSSSFVPTYNPSKYPLMETIALHHASTITTLKFCGFRGAPAIHNPTRLASSILDPLRHLHNLQHLTMAFWMRTTFEGQTREDQLRSYWFDQQSSHSTALAMPANAYAENPWAKTLVDYFAPAILADNVASLLAPLLSKQALARRGGVTVKALFLLGDHEIVDFDVQLGANGEVVSHRGPRSEWNAEKVKEKLETRAWF